ncbi:hypothetical protein BRARA_D01992, partial [Brassica rapa]
MEINIRVEEAYHIMNVQTKQMIMAVGQRNRIPQGFQGDEEVEMVYLHFDVASRPSLSCDGLVCIPVPGWVNVFNPSTGEFRRFPSGPYPVMRRYANHNCVFDVFPGYWRMGFGRDNVSGSYKIVRMGFNHHWEIHRCEILDVNIGRWQKLSPPPYEIGYRRKSTCVNGSIYWTRHNKPNTDQKLLALDLHEQEWRDVGLPLEALGKSFQVANLENRLALAATYIENDHWNVKIWSAEAPEETWSVVYSIRLFPLDHPYDDPSSPLWYWTRPVAVSKKGNLFVQDSYKRLFKCYPETGEVRLIAAEICVISPFVENLVPLG